MMETILRIQTTDGRCTTVRRHLDGSVFLSTPQIPPVPIGTVSYDSASNTMLVFDGVNWVPTQPSNTAQKPKSRATVFGVPIYTGDTVPEDEVTIVGDVLFVSPGTMNKLERGNPDSGIVVELQKAAKQIRTTPQYTADPTLIEYMKNLGNQP